jgi:hypothetical protein
MQLVRVIEVGMEVDSDGARDLDPSRIYYHGNSLGAMYGTTFVAVEPAVRVAALIVPGGMAPEHNRNAPSTRPANGRELAARTPSLLNSPGITELDGVPVGPPHSNENKPLRNRPPVINTVEGAMAIQEVMEWAEWGRQSGGTPVVYAPYLRKRPLVGVPPKPVIYLFAKGDQISINPGTTALLRAGDLADRATHYRNDLAFAEDPTIPRSPHSFALGVTDANPLVRAVSRGAQEQVAVFLETDGAVVIHPEPARFFEVPVQGPLPEDLNFIA